MLVDFACPKCGSKSFQKRGQTKTEEPQQRYSCNNQECNKWFVSSLVEIADDSPEFLVSKTRAAELERKKRYFISCSQNNTPVEPGFWKAMHHYCADRSATLIITTLRYRNPTSIWNKQDSDHEIWWPDEVLPYLVENDLCIHPSLKVMGRMRLQATAVNPLEGLDSFSQGASAIYGHNQIQMKTVPTPQHMLPKILHTTGSCSIKNYSRTKAGVKGAFHHSIGGVIVEKKGKKFHMRAVVWDGRGFYDLEHYYTADGVQKAGPVEALITGDEHALFYDRLVRKGTYDAHDSIAKTLKPKLIVRHDVFDGYSISHHHAKSPVTQYVKRREGLDVLKGELELTARFIDDTTPKGSTNVIVASNHNEHLMRWLNEVDWKKEMWNARMYFWFWDRLLDDAKFTSSGVSHFDPFAFWAEQHVKSSTKFLKRDEPCNVAGVELSLHGDRGPNGSRGSAINLNKIGVKTVIGHGHSPRIEKGCVSVGVSTGMKLEYTSGPSSWLNTHCVVYPNGKRQLLTVLDGTWRG